MSIEQSVSLHRRSRRPGVSRWRGVARHDRGLSLVEFLVALTVLAIVVLAGAPSLRGFLERNRLVSAGEAVYTQARQARAEALSYATPVTLSLLPGKAWCAGHRAEKLAAGPGSPPEPCDCRRQDSLDPDACMVEAQGDRLLRAVTQSAFPDIAMAEGVPAIVRFHGVRGTASPGAAIALVSASGLTLRVEVAPTGNVRLCAPGAPMRGYPAC